MRKAVFAIAGAIIVAAAIAAVIRAWQTRTIPGVADNVKSFDNTIISTIASDGDHF